MKQVIFSLLTSIIFLNTNAQFAKGDKFIGINFNLNNTKDSFLLQQQKSNALIIGVSYDRFYSETHSGGFSVNFLNRNSKLNSTTINNKEKEFGFGLSFYDNFYRISKNNKKLAFFYQPSGSISYNSKEYDPNNIGVSNNITKGTLTLANSVGVSYFITKKLQVQITTPSLFSISLQSTKFKSNNNSNNSSTNFNINSNINLKSIMEHSNVGVKFRL